MSNEEKEYLNEVIQVYNETGNSDFLVLRACTIQTIDRPEVEQEVQNLVVRATEGEPIELLV